MIFKVGDKVRVIKTVNVPAVAHLSMYGSVGKVLDIRYISSYDKVGVEFSVKFAGAGDCSSLCRFGYGWYLYTYELEPYLDVVTGVLQIGDI